ncbi:C4-dicarboxylate ABC transporter substrate-binding protein [Pueribacillus theae]|uniref:C4-dicarboxylate ABC transporter substrate-binding protein n=1 Tax=Pueribacillus theae TaxID=2171751 RepID=A0A2U1JS20_9BACI|nr:TAXI family TRAP transporter solute-binding subunit [Pueribacillus theae]PWA07795.1 C4-dicarboxylate ABC transporter substrate-binding protein [Pueribacillus theae]
MKNFRILSLILTFAFVLILAACGGSIGESTSSNGGEADSGLEGSSDSTSGETQSVVLTTAGTSGTFYAVGAAFTQIVNNNSNVLDVTNQASGGSVENVRLIDNKEVAFAMLGGDSAVDAYNGKREFEGEPRKDELKGLFSMYSQPLNLVALADSGIKSFSDLEGKKVAVGAPGSGSEVKSQITLESLGLPYDSGVKQQYLSFSEAADGMKDGQIDAAFVWAGVPTPAVQDLAAIRDIVVIPFTDEEVEKVNAAQEAIYGETIPGGTYDGVDEDIQTLAVNTQVVAGADVDEEIVYEFVKQIFDHIDDVHAAHNSMKEMTLESAPKNVIELHPGAKKYFEEKGVLSQ